MLALGRLVVSWGLFFWRLLFSSEIIWSDKRLECRYGSVLSPVRSEQWKKAYQSLLC